MYLGQDTQPNIPQGQKLGQSTARLQSAAIKAGAPTSILDSAKQFVTKGGKGVLGFLDKLETPFYAMGGLLAGVGVKKGIQEKWTVSDAILGKKYFSEKLKTTGAESYAMNIAETMFRLPVDILTDPITWVNPFSVGKNVVAFKDAAEGVFRTSEKGGAILDHMTSLNMEARYAKQGLGAVPKLEEATKLGSKGFKTWLDLKRESFLEAKKDIGNLISTSQAKSVRDAAKGLDKGMLKTVFEKAGLPTTDEFITKATTEGLPELYARRMFRLEVPFIEKEIGLFGYDNATVAIKRAAQASTNFLKKSELGTDLVNGIERGYKWAHETTRKNVRGIFKPFGVSDAAFNAVVKKISGEHYSQSRFADDKIDVELKAMFGKMLPKERISISQANWNYDYLMRTGKADEAAKLLASLPEEKKNILNSMRTILDTYAKEGQVSGALDKIKSNYLTISFKHPEVVEKHIKTFEGKADSASIAFRNAMRSNIINPNFLPKEVLDKAGLIKDPVAIIANYIHAFHENEALKSVLSGLVKDYGVAKYIPKDVVAKIEDLPVGVRKALLTPKFEGVIKSIKSAKALKGGSTEITGIDEIAMGRSHLRVPVGTKTEWMEGLGEANYMRIFRKDSISETIDEAATRLNITEDELLEKIARNIENKKSQFKFNTSEEALDEYLRGKTKISSSVKDADIKDVNITVGKIRSTIENLSEERTYLLKKFRQSPSISLNDKIDINKQKINSLRNFLDNSHLKPAYYADLMKTGSKEMQDATSFIKKIREVNPEFASRLADIHQNEMVAVKDYITGLKADGEYVSEEFAKLVDSIKGVEEMQLPRWILEEVVSRQSKDIFAKNTGIGSFFRGWQKLQSWFKFGVTIPFPAFYIQNMLGDTFRRYFEEGWSVFSPIVHKQNLDLLSGKVGAIEGKYGEILTTDMLSKEIQRSNFSLGSGRADYDKAIIIQTLKDHPMVKHTVGDYLSGMEKFASWREGAWNKTAYVNMRIRGFSPADALQKVNSAMVDYGDATAFEKQVLTQIFPFYKWYKSTFIQMAQKAVTETGKFVKVKEGLDKFNKIYGQGKVPPDEERFLPLYIKNQPYFWMGTKDGTNRFLYNFNLPIENAFDTWTNPLKSGFSLASPFLKVGIEMATGVDLFKGTQISKDFSGAQFQHSPKPLKDLLDFKEVKKTDSRGKEYSVFTVDPEKKVLFNWIAQLAGGSRFMSSSNQADLASFGSVFKLMKGQKVNRDDLYNLIHFTTGIMVYAQNPSQDMSSSLAQMQAQYGDWLVKSGEYNTFKNYYEAKNVISQ